MIRIMFLTALIFFLFLCSAHKTYSSSSFLKNVTEEIKQPGYESISAEFRPDTVRIARVLHKDFIAVYPDTLQNKQHEPDGIYKGVTERISNGEEIDSFYPDNFQVRFYSNTAIATFRTVTKGRRKEVPYSDQI